MVRILKKLLQRVGVVNARPLASPHVKLPVQLLIKSVKIIPKDNDYIAILVSRPHYRAGSYYFKIGAKTYKFCS